MIAIAEHYAKEHFGPNTISSMISTPRHYIGAFAQYIDKDDEYLKDIKCEMPTSITNEIDKGMVWVGYYHQKAEYASHRERIGKQIAELRIKRGLSTRQLAEMSGVHFSNVGKIEQGRYNVSVDILGKVVDALGAEIKIEEAE